MSTKKKDKNNFYDNMDNRNDEEGWEAEDCWNDEGDLESEEVLDTEDELRMRSSSGRRNRL